jgi:UDP:flavonoid glycosyltransferase YjiC (YdhE family)
VRLPLEAAPAEIASALGELLTRPRFTHYAERAAEAIAADASDETATRVLLNLAQVAT